jgi:hypothetical protein
VINVLVKHNAYVFEHEPIPPHIDPTLATDIEALMHVFYVGARANWSRLTHTYLGGYTSINSQQVIDPKCRALTMCSSERSRIQLGGLSSNDCAAKERRRSGP